jgi:hypothetical protein
MLEEIEGFVEVKRNVRGRGVREDQSENPAHVERLSAKQLVYGSVRLCLANSLQEDAPSSAPIRPESSHQK